MNEHGCVPRTLIMDTEICISCNSHTSQNIILFDNFSAIKNVQVIISCCTKYTATIEKSMEIPYKTKNRATVFFLWSCMDVRVGL